MTKNIFTSYISSMKILPISNQNNKKPTFKGVDFFNTIKTLPGMTCAICGKPTLSNDLYVKALTPLSKSLAYNISKGVLNYLEIKYPLVWAKLQEFVARFPKMSLDEILDDNTETYVELKQAVVQTLEPEPVPNGTPERIELERNIGKVFFDAIDNARSYMKCSSTVMKQLIPLKEYLPAPQQEVFEQLEIYSRKYPRKTLSEIVSLPEIHKFHAAKNILQRTETREKLDYHFENIHNLIKSKKPKAVEYFDELKEKVLDMYEEINDEEARKFLAREMYKEALKEHNCEAIQEEVLAELGKVPTTFLTKDSYFNHAYTHEYTDFQIVKSLFSGLLASEDHIVPVSKGGMDKVENKTVVHRNCNHKRGSDSYAQTIKYYPEFPANAQKQIDLISENILNGNLPSELRFYPLKVADNYLKESDGLIDLDITEYCTQGLEQSCSRIDSNEGHISYLISEKQKINQSISDLVDSNKKERNLQSRMREYLDNH